MSNPPDGARILIYDIETAPLDGLAWKTWDTNIIKVRQDWYMLSVAWKWLGEKETYVLTLQDFERRFPQDDLGLAMALHALFDQADVTVTHNGRTFDKPKAQTRMIVHGLTPPSPYKEVDTLKVARQQFAFTSNRLGDLCGFLDLPHKGDPGGVETWVGCMEDKPAAFKRMAKYNKQDVKILEKLYLRLLPWIRNHPNMAVIADRPSACTYCLTEGRMQARGYHYYSVTRRRRFQCQECGAYVGSRKTERIPSDYVSI